MTGRSSVASRDVSGGVLRECGLRRNGNGEARASSERSMSRRGSFTAVGGWARPSTGEVVTATATDSSSGDTSELSACIVVSGAETRCNQDPTFTVNTGHRRHADDRWLHDERVHAARGDRRVELSGRREHDRVRRSAAIRRSTSPPSCRRSRAKPWSTARASPRERSSSTAPGPASRWTGFGSRRGRAAPRSEGSRSATWLGTAFASSPRTTRSGPTSLARMARESSSRAPARRGTSSGPTRRPATSSS